MNALIKMSLNKYNETFLSAYIQVVLYKKLYKKNTIFLIYYILLYSRHLLQINYTNAYILRYIQEN